MRFCHAEQKNWHPQPQIDKFKIEFQGDKRKGLLGSNWLPVIKVNGLGA